MATFSAFDTAMESQALISLRIDYTGMSDTRKQIANAKITQLNEADMLIVGLLDIRS